jgi:CBS domain-containing protein
MHVAAILKEKGRAVETITMSSSVMEVAQKLAARRIGALVVLGPDLKVAGIISERDIIRVVGEHGTAALQWNVTDAMTRDIVPCRETDTLDQLMSLMTVHRFRHLPVIENDMLVGLVSIGDVVKHHIAEVELEASAMRDYITTH